MLILGSLGIILSATIAANAPAASQALVGIQTSPEKTAVTTFTIPAGQTWIISDVYILVSAGAGTPTVVDPQLKFVKNQVDVMGQTVNLSAMLVSNNSRPVFQPKLGFEPQSQLEIYYITTVLNGTASSTISAFANVDRRY